MRYLWKALIMFGFIYRLHIQHPDDKENYLVYLQLSQFYKFTGIFKAGKSYMIRSKTKKDCESMIYEIIRVENNLPEPTEMHRWSQGLGCYTVRQHKEFYIAALTEYIESLTRLDYAFRYITDSDKKLSYLEEKLGQLVPYYEKKLLKSELKVPGKYWWHIYRVTI